MPDTFSASCDEPFDQSDFTARHLEAKGVTTMGQIGPLFSVAHVAAHRQISAAAKKL